MLLFRQEQKQNLHLLLFLRQNQDIIVKEIGIDEMKPGLVFPDEDTAVEAVLKWGERALCPLMKARRDKGLAETEGKRRGRRRWKK